MPTPGTGLDQKQNWERVVAAETPNEPVLPGLTPPGMNAQAYGCSSSSQSHPTFPLDLLQCLAECSKNSAKCREEGAGGLEGTPERVDYNKRQP